MFFSPSCGDIVTVVSLSDTNISCFFLTIISLLISFFLVLFVLKFKLDHHRDSNSFVQLK